MLGLENASVILARPVESGVKTLIKSVVDTLQMVCVVSGLDDKNVKYNSFPDNMMPFVCHALDSVF